MGWEDCIIQPPATMSVSGADRAVLYLSDGTPLKRQIGFTMQTTGTFPQTSGNANYGKGSAKTTKGGKGKKHR